MKENNEWMKRFIADLKKIENTQDAAAPNQDQIMNALTKYKKARQKALKRELIVFICTALIILTTYAMVALKLPQVYLWIQALALATVPIIYKVEKKRRSGSEEVAEIDDGR